MLTGKATASLANISRRKEVLMSALSLSIMSANAVLACTLNNKPSELRPAQ